MKRRIHVPGLGRHIVIGGCKLPSHTHGFKLKDFLGTLPPAPATCDYSAAALSVLEDVEGNADYGDCVEAEDAHKVAVETGNSGNGLFAYTDAQTLADYAAITGFNALDPSTDQGTDPIVDLNYRVSKGYVNGTKDLGWAYVDATNKNEVAYAISVFGTVKMWFGIPDSIVNNMPSASGFVWDVTAGAPDQNNGHCVGSCGFSVKKILAVGVTADGLLIYTWGMLGVITWAAVAAWFVSVAGGGMAVRVNQDWVNAKSGNTPAGLNLTGLLTAFNAYFGGTLVIPGPPPAPGPTPSPTPTPAAGVTLIQAQALANGPKGLGSGSFFMTKGQAQSLASAGLASGTGWPT